MMSTTNETPEKALAKNKGFRAWNRSTKRVLSWSIVAAVILVILILALTTQGQSNGRTESYKEVSGAAGLNATITYECDEQPCEQTFDFNVYIYNKDGQQVSVVRPDKDGKVNLALPEGDYVMLIGEQFGKDNVFPQEPLALKNGKTLELKLHYK